LFSKFGDKSKSKSCGDEDSDKKDWFKNDSKDGLLDKDGLSKKFGDFKSSYGYKD
jgi:hypothetical protein